MTAHTWGIAAETMIVGWLAAEGDRINLLVSPVDGGQRHDAIGFLIGFPIGHFCYQRYVRWIYDDRLAGEELDSTIIPRKVVIRFISLKACFVYAIVWFAAVG
jgi:hypothetical protein